MILKFEIDGEHYVFDNEKLMFSEAMAVQKQAGFTTKELQEQAAAGDTAAIGATLWIAVLRHRAAERGVPLRQIAAEQPFADFDFDLNTLRVELPENPTDGPTDGPETPTSPATSAPRPRKTRSKASAPGTSDSSPTT